MRAARCLCWRLGSAAWWCDSPATCRRCCPLNGLRVASPQAGDLSQTGQTIDLLLQSVAANGAYDQDDYTQRLDGLLGTLDGSAYSGRYTGKLLRYECARASWVPGCFVVSPWVPCPAGGRAAHVTTAC